MPFVIPEQGRLQVWVHPDQHEPPEALMVEIITSKATRRAFWGDLTQQYYGVIAGNDRQLIGPMPAAY